MTEPKSSNRRQFIRQTIGNAVALAGIPLLSPKQNPYPLHSGKSDFSNLSLKIFMSQGLPSELQQDLKSDFPQIEFIEGDQRIGEAHAWFGGINEKQFGQATNIRWIQSPSAGVEYYLFPDLVDSQVTLTNAKGCYAPAIAEHTFGLLFSLTRKIGSQTRHMSAGKWQVEDNMIELKGLTMGIVGLGGIGSQIARRARAMDMQVLAVDILPKYQEQIGDICDDVRLVQSDLDWLLGNSDVVVSAAPHTKASEKMFGPSQFTQMKNGSIFINVSRGKLVDTDALTAALDSGHLGGAGLDVTDPEPLPSDHRLWSLSNVIITAHISGRSQHSWNRLLDVYKENVHRFIQGLPLLNQVDKKMGF